MIRKCLGICTLIAGTATAGYGFPNLVTGLKKSQDNYVANIEERIEATAQDRTPKFEIMDKEAPQYLVRYEMYTAVGLALMAFSGLVLGVRGKSEEPSHKPRETKLDKNSRYDTTGTKGTGTIHHKKASKIKGLLSKVIRRGRRY